MTPARLTAEAGLLVEAAASAPSADNSQPWCFEWGGGVLTGRAVRRGGFPLDYHATTLALGAAAENLSVAGVALGVDITAWFFGPPAADGVFAKGSVPRLEYLPTWSDRPVWKRRHTNRLPYQRQIDPSVADMLSGIGVGEVRTQVLQRADIQPVAGWVKQASEVRFQTREVSEWFAGSLRYGSAPEARSHGLHVDTLALPPGGVALLKLMSSWQRMQWLNRVKAYRLFAAIEAANFRKAPLIAAIVGPADDASAFNAGRCLQRVWLRVTDLGLSAQPYYVVSDLLGRLARNRVPDACGKQALAVKAQVESAYGRGQMLHCLLRVGKPVGEVPVAGRLSLDRIMCQAIS